MGRTMTVAPDPSAPAGHLPALRAGRNETEPERQFKNSATTM